MHYPGVKDEDQSKMAKCVSKIEANGKSNAQAIALCKLSINNQVVPENKEKPWKVVEGKDSSELTGEDRCLFFSSSDFSQENKTINSSSKGTLIKNIEIFKAGTFRGIQFKNSALDKMVANFHYLKAMGVFPNVPVRADHTSFFGGGDIIDKVGGYIEDLRRAGTKLVADIRVTSQDMLEKITNGTYINRSAEIGTYDDNDGVLYTPALYGFAWVDIPQVEKLSPKFNYKKDNVELSVIKLNKIDIMSKKKDNFPPEDEKEVKLNKEEVVEEKVETPAVEAPEVETPVEKTPEELAKEEADAIIAAAKEGEDKKEKPSKEEVKEVDYKEKYQASVIDGFLKEGKIAPANLEAEQAFAKTLDANQFEMYVSLKNAEVLDKVELDKDVVGDEDKSVKPPVDGDEDKKEKEKVEKETKEFLED